MSQRRTNKPLTLEQLKQMNGQPVWWWNKSQKPTVTICLFDRFSKEPSFVSYDFVSEEATQISKYSLIRRWGYLPYASDPNAHKPAHIDREKWGPCDFCCREMTCETCNTALSHCGYCRITSKGKSEWKNIGTLFCRWCGRPLTEAAWAELERRVFGE